MGTKAITPCRRLGYFMCRKYVIKAWVTILARSYVLLLVRSLARLTHHIVCCLLSFTETTIMIPSNTRSHSNHLQPPSIQLLGPSQESLLVTKPPSILRHPRGHPMLPHLPHPHHQLDTLNR